MLPACSSNPSLHVIAPRVPIHSKLQTALAKQFLCRLYKIEVVDASTVVLTLPDVGYALHFKHNEAWPVLPSNPKVDLYFREAGPVQDDDMVHQIVSTNSILSDKQLLGQSSLSRMLEN